MIQTSVPWLIFFSNFSNAFVLYLFSCLTFFTMTEAIKNVTKFPTKNKFKLQTSSNKERTTMFTLS